MRAKEFFKLTKAKIIYLLAITLIILISGILAQNIIYCIQAPCNQPASTIINQGIYNVVTFGKLFINTGFAVKFKNLLQPTFSAGESYLILSFVISIILHYILISLILGGYNYFRRKSKHKTKKIK